MKYKRKRLQLAIILYLIFCIGGNVLLITNSMPVYAGKKSQQTMIPLENIMYSCDGGKTALSEQEEDRLEVEFDTTGEDKGYYTSFIFSEQNKTLENGTVLSFHIAAHTNVRLNINIIEGAKDDPYQVGDGSMIFLKADESTKYEMLPVEYGTFEIPENFSGTVYLPVTAKDGLQTEGIGFIVVQEEEQKTNISIGTLYVSDEYEVEDELFRSQFEIEGNTSPEIPVTGEYYYEYAVSLKKEEKELDCKFYLEDSFDGISLGSEGRLYVSENAKEETVPILVEINGILQYRFQVKLSESWLVKAEDVDVSNFIVPQVGDVEKIETGFSISIVLIRGVFFVAVICLFAFYIRRVRKKG